MMTDKQAAMLSEIRSTSVLDLDAVRARDNAQYGYAVGSARTPMRDAMMDRHACLLDIDRLESMVLKQADLILALQAELPCRPGG